MMNRTFLIGNKSDLPKPDVVFPAGKVSLSHSIDLMDIY
jgi:hypothetical protein